MFTMEYPGLEPFADTVMDILGHSVDITIADSIDEDLYEEEDEERVSSCDPDQPLVKAHFDALDAEVFSKVQNCLRDHPYISEKKLNQER